MRDSTYSNLFTGFEKSPVSFLWVFFSMGVLILLYRLFIYSKSRFDKKAYMASIGKKIGVSDLIWKELEYDTKCRLKNLWVMFKSMGIKLTVLADDRISYFNQSVCSFSEKDMEVKLCIGVNQKTWVKFLLREMSRVDQFSEKCKEWENRIYNGKDVRDLFNDWVAERIELDYLDLKRVIERYMALEYDCEKRTIEKVSNSWMDLGVSVEEYTKMANARLLGLYMVKLKRGWYKVDPESEDMIWYRMADSLMEFDEYFFLPWQIASLYENYCYNVKLNNVINLKEVIEYKQKQEMEAIV